jgi:hypothetical protein
MAGESECVTGKPMMPVRTVLPAMVVTSVAPKVV